MSDPNRWLDDETVSSEVRALLSSAQRTPGIPYDDDAVLRSAMEKIAAGTLATSTTGTSIIAKLAAWIVVVAIGGGVLYWAVHREVGTPMAAPREQPVAYRTVTSARVDGGALSIPMGHAAVQPSATATTELPRVEAPRPTRRVEAGAHLEPSHRAATDESRVERDADTPVEATAAVSGPPTVPSAAAPADPLAVEFQYIGRARTLCATDPAQALSELEGHAHLFPNGALAAERDYLFVDVLVRLGRNEDARAKAREFLERHAESPYAPIVRRTLEAL